MGGGGAILRHLAVQTDLELEIFGPLGMTEKKLLKASNTRITHTQVSCCLVSIDLMY